MTDAPHRHSYDWSEAEGVATAVVEAIAETTGAGVTAFALSEYVDPDALNALFRPRPNGAPRATGRVSFPVEGHRVVVRADGEILVYPPSDEDGDSDETEFDESESEAFESDDESS